jgi:hypothetical protein
MEYRVRRWTSCSIFEGIGQLPRRFHFEFSGQTIDMSVHRFVVFNSPVYLSISISYLMIVGAQEPYVTVRDGGRRLYCFYQFILTRRFS